MGVFPKIGGILVAFFGGRGGVLNRADKKVTPNFLNMSGGGLRIRKFPN